MSKTKDVAPILPSVLRELIKTLEGDAAQLDPKNDDSEWWRFATVIKLLATAEELIQTDPDYNSRITHAIALARAAVEVQRAEGVYRREAAQKDDC